MSHCIRGLKTFGVNIRWTLAAISRLTLTENAQPEKIEGVPKGRHDKALRQRFHAICFPVCNWKRVPLFLRSVTTDCLNYLLEGRLHRVDFLHGAGQQGVDQSA